MKNEYDPSRDNRSNIQYARWGKSGTGDLEESSSSALTPEQIAAYREYMAKEAEEFTFHSDRPDIRDVDENIGTPNNKAVSPKVPTIYQQKEFTVNVPEASKELLEKGYETHKRIHQRSMGIPTDIRVNRRDIDIPVTKVGHSEVLNLADTNPIIIMQLCNDVLGEDWIDWEPETITETFEAEGISVHPVTLNKMFALRIVIKTERFEEDPFIFEKVVTAFSNRVVDWTIVQQPRVFDIAATVALIDRFIKTLRFSEDISSYTAACAITDGYVILPPELMYCDASFAVELAMTVGDDVLEIQDSIMSLMKTDAEEIPEEYQPQYMRLLRCQYHVKSKIDEVE